MDVKVISDRDAWNEAAEAFGAHPLQHWQWGQLKAETGPWTAHRLLVTEDGQTVGGAQVLERSMPLPFRATCYAPRGPFAQEGRLMEVADAVADWCKASTKAVSVKVDPAVNDLQFSEGWVPSESIMLGKTAVIDLMRDEDEIMQGIPNRKCRQYIRKGEREGVVVRPAEEGDLDAILRVYHATAEADGFALHADEFYRAAFNTLGDTQQVFVADKDGDIQAFLWNAISRGGTAFELYGAVTDAGKRTRANYYMKWVAIKAAKEYGARLYDLNGLLNDGISDFKLLFVPEPTYWVDTHDKPLSPLYGLMDKAIEMRRKHSERKAAQEDTAR